MYAFYVVRGWKLSDLVNLSAIEKMFLHHARERHYNEEYAKMKVLGGGMLGN